MVIDSILLHLQSHQFTFYSRSLFLSVSVTQIPPSKIQTRTHITQNKRPSFVLLLYKNNDSEHINENELKLCDLVIIVIIIIVQLIKLMSLILATLFPNMNYN